MQRQMFAKGGSVTTAELQALAEAQGMTVEQLLSVLGEIALRDNPRLAEGERQRLAQLLPSEFLAASPSLESEKQAAFKKAIGDYRMSVMDFNRLSQRDQEALTGMMPNSVPPMAPPTDAVKDYGMSAMEFDRLFLT
jgi:hypothetical protein